MSFNWVHGFKGSLKRKDEVHISMYEKKWKIVQCYIGLTSWLCIYERVGVFLTFLISSALIAHGGATCWIWDLAYDRLGSRQGLENLFLVVIPDLGLMELVLELVTVDIMTIEVFYEALQQDVSCPVSFSYGTNRELNSSKLLGMLGVIDKCCASKPLQNGSRWPAPISTLPARSGAIINTQLVSPSSMCCN